MDEVVDIAVKYRHRCDRTKILPSSFWTKDRAQAASLDKSRYSNAFADHITLFLILIQTVLIRYVHQHG